MSAYSSVLRDIEISRYRGADLRLQSDQHSARLRLAESRRRLRRELIKNFDHFGFFIRSDCSAQWSLRGQRRIVRWSRSCQFHKSLFPSRPPYCHKFPWPDAGVRARLRFNCLAADSAGESRVSRDLAETHEVGAMSIIDISDPVGGYRNLAWIAEDGRDTTPLRKKLLY